MKTKALILMAFLCAGLSLHAAPERVMTIKVSVDGMVCSFCAQGVLRHLGEHEAISNIHVSLGRKLVLLEERKGKSISDEEVKKAVERAGFKSGTIKRVETSFEEVKKEE